MSTFIVVAALMAALAAAAVAVPLLRARETRIVGALAAVMIAGLAAGLYPLWSNWDWHQAEGQAGAPDVQAMVKQLEAHLADNPNDLEGWLMLGRSYVTLERLDDAMIAFDHAHRLDTANADAALGLGEAMSLKAGGNITPEAVTLFEQALAQAPENPKALLYGGFAAAARGDFAAARARWVALKEMHPPAQIEQLLDARIAELGTAPAGTAPGGIAPGGTAPGGSAPGGIAPGGTAPGAAAVTPTGAGAAQQGDAEATVNIRLAPALQARLTREAPLFVFARETGVQGPPLAAKRLTSAAIGTQVHLSAADSMIPTRVLTGGRKVSITARVSFAGQPLPAAGDLYGEIIYDVGRDGPRDLVIDRVAE